MLKLIQKVIDQRGISKAAERAKRQEEKCVPISDSELTLGFTLRFSPPEVRIRINPATGWDFEGPSCDTPPQLPIEPHRLAQIKVGILIDGTSPRRRPDKSGDVVERYNINEPVCLRLTVKKPGWEICDSMGRHVPDGCIRFDQDYKTDESKTIAADRLQKA